MFAKATVRTVRTVRTEQLGFLSRIPRTSGSGLMLVGASLVLVGASFVLAGASLVLVGAGLVLTGVSLVRPTANICGYCSAQIVVSVTGLLGHFRIIGPLTHRCMTSAELADSMTQT